MDWLSVPFLEEGARRLWGAHVWENALSTLIWADDSVVGLAHSHGFVLIYLFPAHTFEDPS